MVSFNVTDTPEALLRSLNYISIVVLCYWIFNQIKTRLYSAVLQSSTNLSFLATCKISLDKTLT